MNKKNFIRQTIRFGFVGILNTIIGYGSYYILIKCNMFYVLASFISTIIGVINSYFCNKYFTFKSHNKSFKEILRFISVYACTFLINISLLGIFVQRFGMSKEKAGLVAMLVVTGISFLGHKFWSFKGTSNIDKITP